VIVVGTAFGGAWTILVGALALAAWQGAAPRGTGGAWILYPLSPAPEAGWLVTAAWVALGLTGMAVQLALTARHK
jgi:hypothetical protein